MVAVFLIILLPAIISAAFSSGKEARERDTECLKKTLDESKKLW